MTAPLVPLEDLQMLTFALLACGARIDEINILRRHLDRVKGGGLVRAANGARILSLILSDVVGDPLEAIASGPTAPDPTTCEDARTVLQKYKLNLPTSIMQALEETLKPGDALFSRVENKIIVSNEIAARAALTQAEREGFQVELLTTHLQGEAREVGFSLASKFRVGKMLHPYCLVAGGETTVTLCNNPGRGGRNQELALVAIPILAGMKDVMLISLATDGEDGPTDAAGAWADQACVRTAVEKRLTPSVYLVRNDAYHFFEPLGGLLRTGPTHTNVCDLRVILVTRSAWDGHTQGGGGTRP